MWECDESLVTVHSPHRAMTRVIGRFSTSDVVDPLTFDSSMSCERHKEKTPNHLSSPHRSNSTPTTPYVITVGIDSTFPLPPSPLVTQKSFPPEANQENSCSSRLFLCPATVPLPKSSADKPPQSSQRHGPDQSISEWIDQSTQDNPLNNRTPSPMFSKDSPSSSNRSSTSSSNSSGYLGSSNQVNHPSPSGGRQSRLSGQSCESGVSGVSSSSRYSYLSGSSSSQNSLDRLEETGTHSIAVHVHELFQQGLQEAEVLHAWLSDLHLAECYPLFVHAGYDMPTISRMTPEDLTAIGITQPNVRKRLTSEISKLHICDGIPNHKPTSLLEWLQCLHLEEYHQVLARDGYEDLDHVTDIIWEDLEDIGIHKLGHQKKMMLAIDRLKKLNVSNRRLSSLDPSIPPTDHPTSARSSVTRTTSTTSPSYVNPSILEQAARKIRRSLSGENMSSLIHQNDPVDSSRILQLRPQVASVPQPELVVIQVNNASRSWSSSVSDDTEGLTPIKYESFHGNPFQDFHCLRKETDGGDTTPTNDKGAASSDEMESTAACVRFRPQLAPKPKLTCRMRRASGGSAVYGETELSIDPALWNGSFHGFNERGVDGLVTAPKGSPELTRPTSATVSYHSVPNTPAHSSSRGGGSRKTAPPPPPKRTNSVKGGMSPPTESDCAGVVEFSKPLSPLLRSKPGSTLAVTSSPSCTGSKSAAPLVSPVSSPCSSSSQKPHAEMNPTENPSILSPAKQKDQPTDASPLKRKVLPQSAATASGGADCNTLPFANENVGTIKQRVANKPLAVLPNKPTVRTDLKSSGQASLGCTEKTLPPGKADTGSPSKKPVRPVPKQKPKLVRTDLKNPDSTGGGVKVDGDEKEGDVFNDIDDLFQGLSQELDQMLTFHG